MVLESLYLYFLFLFTIFHYFACIVFVPEAPQMKRSYLLFFLFLFLLKESYNFSNVKSPLEYEYKV